MEWGQCKNMISKVWLSWTSRKRRFRLGRLLLEKNIDLVGDFIDCGRIYKISLIGIMVRGSKCTTQLLFHFAQHGYVLDFDIFFYF